MKSWCLVPVSTLKKKPTVVWFSLTLVCRSHCRLAAGHNTRLNVASGRTLAMDAQSCSHEQAVKSRTSTDRNQISDLFVPLAKITNQKTLLLSGVLLIGVFRLFVLIRFFFFIYKYICVHPHVCIKPMSL